jgi:hypothetical protein
MMVPVRLAFTFIGAVYCRLVGCNCRDELLDRLW